LSQPQEYHSQESGYSMKSKPGNLAYESNSVTVSGNCRDNSDYSDKANQEEKISKHFK
jgi:hypothetical protein